MYIFADEFSSSSCHGTYLFANPFIFATQYLRLLIFQTLSSEMEFKEFEPRFKSAKTRFKLSAGLYFETFDTILGGTIFKPLL